MVGKMGHKACNLFASLPPHARAGLSAFMSGTLFLALFGLAFVLVGRRRCMSREERKERRRQRKEARRAAKNAYKAAKAAKRNARNTKEAEAGYAISTPSDNEEALPSYKDNETDALVERQ